MARVLMQVWIKKRDGEKSVTVENGSHFIIEKEISLNRKFIF